MKNIVSIKELRKQAIQEIEIPGFNGKPLMVKVQRPRLLAMAAEGKIPNALMGIASKIVKGEKKSEFDLAENAKMIEIYCRACMVEPTFEEMEDIMSDEQKFEVFFYAINGVKQLEPFRTNQENGSGDNNGEGIPMQTESNNGD